MTNRVQFMVTVGGSDITGIISPALIELSVSDKAGTHSDTASITLDDTGGRYAIPKTGAPIKIALGWAGAGIREVFDGTVDKVRSTGSRSGRVLVITAKGVDVQGKAKAPQQRQFDNETIEGILQGAGEGAGITEVRVDPALAGIVREYVEMRDESFIHLGERLAREVGGNFRIAGTTAIMSSRGGIYAASVTAAWGDNLHSWDITPEVARAKYGSTEARWYDPVAAKWRKVERETDLDVPAWHTARFAVASEAEAGDRADSDKATTERDATTGSVKIEGNTGAVPDGLCYLRGTRPGIDGVYRIETVTHALSRGSGFTTSLSLKRAEGADETPTGL